MISDILSETRRCHGDDDVTNDVVFTGSGRPASHLMHTSDDTDSAAGDSAFAIYDRLAVIASSMGRYLFLYFCWSVCYRIN